MLNQVDGCQNIDPFRFLWPHGQKMQLMLKQVLSVLPAAQQNYNCGDTSESLQNSSYFLDRV